ncbi:hypothetical protein [Dictyobacter arantiisoli]|uniref:Superoxide dismutase copper/zinc binding domain-containing protein n=1 Tax=Dictyobacter arantiisoli TaxID=2014874 RepID=A0A5A5TDA9_9CHLR|nr:hypothetical protein [Dictyobacter arantiisoli]GCF09452.1 hypothetical protein KDI_30160 [Dictyobacter arantiisoli]
MFTVISLCLLILTAGCHLFDSTAEAAIPTATPTARNAQQASPTAKAKNTPTAKHTSTAPTQASANLNHQPTGTIHLAYDASAKTLNVQGTVNGLAPNSTHTLQIASDTCANPKPTTGQYTLPAIKADTNGHATFNTTFKNVTGGIQASGLAINVLSNHKTGNRTEQVSIACKNINNTHRSTNLQFSLGPTAAPNEKATGKVQLGVKNNSTTVQISARELLPNSSHAATIRMGTCQQPGKVIYDLKNIKADSNGNIHQSTTFKNASNLPSSNMAVFILANPTNTTTKQDSNDLIMCGNLRMTQ